VTFAPDPEEVSEVSWTRWVSAWGLVFALLGSLDVRAAEPSASPEAAKARVVSTVEAAIDHWTEARAMLQDATAGEARARAEGGAGSPFLAWTSEGFDGSFARTANAQDALHLGMPFNWPWQSSAARQYVDAAAEAAGLERDTIGVRVALIAGALWVERSGWLDRVAVHRTRLERIDRALSLQEARYQLGEVSGSEVMQLDLEHVRESSQLAVVEAEAAVRLERLRELCGEDCVDPVPGDLQVLADSTVTPPDPELTEEALEAGGLLRQARAAGAALQARSDLVAATAFGRPIAGVEWEHIPTFAGVPSFDAWGFAVSVPLPVGRAGREARAAARAESLASSERVEGVRRELVRRTQVARVDAETAAARLAALNTALGELARIESSLDQQFRLGVISYLVYLDGVNRLDDVRLDAIGAREQLLLARLELAAILADPAVFPVPVIDEEEQQ
jgi:outer membrane protein TolC